MQVQRPSAKVRFEVINMTQVIIDHTGSCMGHSFVKDVSVDLPDEVIGCLGNHVISGAGQKSVSTPRTPAIQLTRKEAVAPKNRMIKRAKITK